MCCIMIDPSSIIYSLSSDFRIKNAKEVIKRKGWVKEGLGMQIRINEQHERNVNLHVHILRSNNKNICVISQWGRRNGMGLATN